MFQITFQISWVKCFFPVMFARCRRLGYFISISYVFQIHFRSTRCVYIGCSILVWTPPIHFTWNFRSPWAHNFRWNFRSCFLIWNAPVPLGFLKKKNSPWGPHMGTPHAWGPHMGTPHAWGPHMGTPHGDPTCMGTPHASESVKMTSKNQLNVS